MRTHELLKVMMLWELKDVHVCPVNMLDLTQSGIYIVNTDCGPGKHWVAMYVTHDTVEFFCSFGHHPRTLQNGSMFMKAIQGKRLIVHSKWLQELNTRLCGVYCLAFVYSRSKDKLLEFFNRFDDNRSLNNQKVVMFVNEAIKATQM